jgi:asparagine synthase (glutamine-hydrolysing)
LVPHRASSPARAACRANGEAVRTADDRKAEESQTVRFDFAGSLLSEGSTEDLLSWPGEDREGVWHTQRTAQSLLLVNSRSLEATALTRQKNLTVCVVGSPHWVDGRHEAPRDSESLAESVAAGWRRWGPAFLERLRGPFSVALVESDTRTVLLATDRFGIHPVAWALVGGNGGAVVFASHVGAIRQHPALVDAELNDQAILDYLHFHVVPAPATVYRGIAKLRAGERLLWRDGRLDVARYWEPEFVGASASPADAERPDVLELHKQLHQALNEAVTRATVPAGRTACFLSGGLDSSSVSGVFSRQHRYTAVDAYTIGFEAKGFDEMSYARIAARHFGINLHERYIEPDEVAEAMPHVAAWYDEPFGNSSAVPAFVCANTAAQDGTRRLLAGDGGDELFAGNSRYLRQQLFSYYDRLPDSLQRLLQGFLLLKRDGGSPFRAVPGLSKLVSYVDQARPGMPARYDSYNYLVRYGAAHVLASPFLKRVDIRHPLTLMEEVWLRAPTDNLLQRMLYLDWQFTLADNDLRKVSEMCAAAGLSVSYPMLDEAVLQLSLQVPPQK